MKYWQIPNWSEHQHYKKPKPPWIKLHRDLIRDYEFMQLSDTDKWVVIGLWLIAAETGNKIPDDPGFIRSSLHLKKCPELERLESLGWIRSTLGPGNH